MKAPIALLICLVSSSIVAQEITQNIRGKVVDAESKQPLIGATVAAYQDSVLIAGGAVDVDGYYKIENVPVGRYTIITSFMGYEQVVMANIIVNSARETILNLGMEESAVAIEAFEVTATGDKGEAINEMALVSARMFSVEESERYAGSRGDPARMASNFAGVQGSDDTRNDVVVRGNSPFGVLYRLEGVNIPNPSHFAITGSTGGPLAILNNKVLSNSDFYTGAFPAEYGNGTAAVFDLNMRAGNDRKHEFTAQFGALGTEVTAEGPISKKDRVSYLANFRYGTLEILNAMGINLGTSATPKFWDWQFKLNVPTKTGGNISVFSIGGSSNVDFITSTITAADTAAAGAELYSAPDRNEYFKAGMGIGGINWTQTIGKKSYMQLTGAFSREVQQNYHDQIVRNAEYVVTDSFPKLGYYFVQDKYSLNWFLNTKINPKHSIKLGFMADRYQIDLQDSLFVDSTMGWVDRVNYQGGAFLLQPFAQWLFKVNRKWTINAGIHGQWWTLNGSHSIEPRLGIRWRFKSNQTLSFGFGMHSQMQPAYIYFQNYQYPNGSYDNSFMHNSNLDFTRSTHVVLGYNNNLTKNIRVKFEAYYQYLSGVPVEVTSSSYSILNAGGGFDRIFPGQLQNTGTADNFGAELTFEKFFSKNWFFMFTGAIYDSKYQSSDGNRYDSDYNGNYMFNILGTKEFRWGKKKKSTIGVGANISVAGGKLYTPIDIAASDAQGTTVYVDSLRNSQRFSTYFRPDLKLYYRLNGRKLMHEIGVDLVNFANIENVLRQRYVGGKVVTEMQLDFLPIFYYRVDFSIKGKRGKKTETP